MSIWAAISDVQGKIRNFDIGATSNPSTTEIQKWLDEAEAAIRMALQGVGIDPTSWTSTDDQGLYLGGYARDFALGNILAAFATAQGDEESDAGSAMIDRLDALIDDIALKPQKYGDMLSAGSPPAGTKRLRSHVLTTTVPDPVWKIGEVL